MQKGQKYLEKNTTSNDTFAQTSWKKPKNEYSANLDVNSVPDNEKFWQIVKPLFSNKVKVKATIKLVENYEIVDDKIEIAKLFYKYFVNIVKKLGIFTKEISSFPRK